MYRVFETLDELNGKLEAATGVPMTGNAMVSRNEMLALLDDLRNALPVELDDAQDVLDKQDAILLGAQERADQLWAETEAESRAVMQQAQTDAEAMLADAESRTTYMLSQAKDDSERMVEDARAESERLVAKGNHSFERAVAEGQAEQERLVSESEVVARANDEAHRIVDAAHAESLRLRTEADEFVDSKLASFEETLNGVLRTVVKDRQALRRGAGAAGRAYQQKRDYRD
ncbi:hypothetical protein CPHO_04565 [Corynebacterium phocae]|uniref:Cell division initiation protein n=1 Tax=Corynebacterium phocae TaxID=161895 RepID=A0A1L7D2E7_9CORY|nr:DivIVA domain-containing protein [Corynebacterium phocae]APT92284.1 hypothetical protein CPHO_04565 [Corynebacterium phocae]KAA8725429.1 DivIVA domain-containing protein [Corynebacterium phocae]